MDGIRNEISEEHYPFFQQETHSEFYDDYEDEFSNVIANEALYLARKLEQDYDEIMISVATEVVNLDGNGND